MITTKLKIIKQRKNYRFDPQIRKNIRVWSLKIQNVPF